MKTKFGAIVTDGRGKLGGHVFQGRGQKSVMKTKAGQSLKRTPRQQAQKVLFSTVSARWQSLANTQRDSFERAAKNVHLRDVFGDKKNVNGFSYFTSMNALMLQASFGIVSSVGELADLSNSRFVGAFVYIPSSALYIEFSTLPPAGTRVIVYASPVMSRGITNSFINTVVLTVLPVDSTQLLITPVYSTVFGGFSLGDNFSIGVRLVHPSGTFTGVSSAKVKFIG